MSTQMMEAPAIKLETITLMIARLAQVMAEEVDCLHDMRIQDIAPLQKEKIGLITGLESIQKACGKHPSLIWEADNEEREQLVQVIEMFETIKRENQKALHLALKVNHMVVEAIAESISEEKGVANYDLRGGSEDGSRPITLDQRI